MKHVSKFVVVKFLKKITTMSFPSQIYRDISENINLLNYSYPNNKKNKECHENYDHQIPKGNCFKDSNAKNIIYFFIFSK